MLKGSGEIETDEGVAKLKKGSAIFIPAQENHRFRNTGKKTLRFIDVISFSLITPQ